ncbi:DEAD/DEAH box helicase, partial [Streptomyces sp. NPDC005283]|uniref:DEAD/DEAH box helicase n=1 Tax=Streptomyces sp. NPDC005283 TaxID=3156871 RepID=UPI0034544978
MNRSARTNDRYSNPRTGGSAGSDRGARFRPQGQSRPGNRSGGYGRRPAAVQGEFALPVTTTPALPAVEAFAELDIPAPLLAALRTEGVTVPFPIQAATLPNTLAGRDVLGRGRTGSGKTLA